MTSAVFDLICCLFLIFNLVACTSLQRSPDSGYAGSSPGKSQNSSGGEVEDEAKTALPEDASSSKRIQNLEKKLRTRQEKEHYSRLVQWLANDEERLEYLALPDVEAREKWAQDKQVWLRSQNPSSSTTQLIRSQDIAVGMPQDYVKKSWGDPQSVELSGDPIFKNERWKYMRYVSSPQGFKQEKRTVFFESGKVTGWQTD